jgi:hypothetical protein
MHRDALVLHKAELLDEDIELRRGFRLTTLMRSLIDVAAEQPDDDQLARAVDDALAGGTITRRQLRARAEAVDPLAALRIERALGTLERA